MKEPRSAARSRSAASLPSLSLLVAMKMNGADITDPFVAVTYCMVPCGAALRTPGGIRSPRVPRQTVGDERDSRRTRKAEEPGYATDLEEFTTGVMGVAVGITSEQACEGLRATSQLTLRGTAAVDLYWLPLGAGRAVGP